MATAPTRPLFVLTALVWVMTAGCGTRSAEKSATDAPAKGGAASSAGARVGDRGDERTAGGRDSRTVAPGSRVRLTQKGCIQFEPRWVEVRAGQSLTWDSELESAVTIHVSPGAFEKSDYVVRAGASVSTGPALKPGSYAIWTEPVACQEVPRGVRGSGPGVVVGAAAQNE
jgi:hypothetical protein